MARARIKEQLAAARARQRRTRRTRAKIRGTAARPRLSVFRSLRHMAAQLIDDSAQRTLVAVSDRQLATAPATPVERARAVGQLLAERAKAQGVTVAIFDRGAYRYHGRVKAVADGARSAGLTL